MQKFSSVVHQFYQWRIKHNFSTNANSNIKYMWVMPTVGLNQWKTELDPYRERFTDQEYNSYVEMFQVGKMLLGIRVAAETPDNIVRLYIGTEYEISFSYGDILFHLDVNLLDGTPYSKHIRFPNGLETDLPFVIKPGSLYTGTIYDRLRHFVFDLSDGQSSNCGVIAGRLYKYGVRKTNAIGDESWAGTIDYNTGHLHLVRYNAKNEDAAIKNYEAASSSGGDYGGSGYSSSSSSIGIPYIYATLDGTVKVINPPIINAFEYNIETDELTDLYQGPDGSDEDDSQRGMPPEGTDT